MLRDEIFITELFSAHCKPHRNGYNVSINKNTQEVFVMYYSAGTYEAFAHPEKPKDVDKKSAYIIGTGLAGLTAAFYLVP